MSLRRRVGLARGGPLRRTPFRRKPRGLTPEQHAVQASVFLRDGGCLLHDDPGAGDCHGRPTVHHLRKASQGGPYEHWNLVTLCAHHNDWVEDYPLVAHTLGLVIRRGEEPIRAWRRLVQLGMAARIPDLPAA